MDDKLYLDYQVQEMAKENITLQKVVALAKVKNMDIETLVSTLNAIIETNRKSIATLSKELED